MRGFAAASSTACTSAVCATSYPSNCANNANVTANYTAWTDYVSSEPPTSTPVAAGNVCLTVTATCDADAVAQHLCDSSLIGNVRTTYSSVDLNGCSFFAFFASTFTSIYDLTFCATTNCNSPAASSASNRIAPLEYFNLFMLLTTFALLVVY